MLLFQHWEISQDIPESEKIEAGEVLLNYGIEKEKSKILKEKDIISIRKKGKFIIESILGETKKGKTRILAKKFS